MGKYSIDQRAVEYLKENAAFEEQLTVWETLFSNTTLARKLEEISELVQSAYEINEAAGFFPESEAFSDVEKFTLAVRFDPEGLHVRSLKDVPRELRKEFEISEQEFQNWMKEKRDELETALIDMEDLIESIEDNFRTPIELEELDSVINDALESGDPSYKVLNQFSINLVSMWEEFSSTAEALVCLLLDINEDVDRTALLALLYNN